ncbi:hypothetical protein KG091_05785 [Carnobacteriaceae bacterium zg-ZUI78]|nr:hypothetical protein [Carnobacteriaceae bacterium zg-ZUI78]
MKMFLNLLTVELKRLSKYALFGAFGLILLQGISLSFVLNAELNRQTFISNAEKFPYETIISSGTLYTWSIMVFSIAFFILVRQIWHLDFHRKSNMAIRLFTLPQHRFVIYLAKLVAISSLGILFIGLQLCLDNLWIIVANFFIPKAQQVEMNAFLNMYANYKDSITSSLYYINPWYIGRTLFIPFAFIIHIFFLEILAQSISYLHVFIKYTVLVGVTVGLIALFISSSIYIYKNLIGSEYSIFLVALGMIIVIIEILLSNYLLCKKVMIRG